jgi:argininosuccinate lyase
MKGLEITRTTLRILAKVVAGTTVDRAVCRAAFTPGVFATDVALRKVAQGTPWRDAYHDVRDHLERLGDEDPDSAVAAKTHEGTTSGINMALYKSRLAASGKSFKVRLNNLEKCKRSLFKA